MAPKRGAVINIGKAVREGLRLKAREAVALVYDACAQLDTGVDARLPTSMDELSVSNTGFVVLPRTGEPEAVQTAVAGLLEALLGTVTDEVQTIPPSLRSLPTRLREASTDTPPPVRDLLSVLRWHLRHDPRQVLRELVARATGAKVEQMPLWRKPGEQRPAPHDAGPPTSDAIRKRPAARRRQFLAIVFVAAALAAFALSGYAGYRYLTWPGLANPLSSAQANPAPSSAQVNPAPPGEAEKAPTDEPRVSPGAARDEPRPLPLPVRGGAFSPSFTAQPRTLLFHAGHNTAGHLYTATLDDRGLPSQVSLLLDEPARNYHARLSPDGKWIAFDSDRDGERGVYIADKNGAGISRVNGDGFGAVPSWSPDMASLAFIRAEPGRPRVWNLWIRDLATGALSRATSHRSGQVWGASWFPDSESYAYTHETDLIIADRSGRQRAVYPSPVPGRMVRTPAVSPDGREIVFQVFREGAWILDLATGTMRGVLEDPSAEEFAWDPSGRRIAYHSRRDGEWRIWLLTL
jgi:Tol biopolymer transport system component